MEEIDFKTIEKKWQDKWEQEKIFNVNEDSQKKKYYCLEMFPYPSGSGLHMGHAWNYSIGDILARFKIMQGYNVLHPMGYDALGLPAENAAIKENIHPSEYTSKSMQNFKEQQKAIGLSYDWDRLLATCDPEYYKWDQWIFLKMFEKGLAYQKESAVNWCIKCDTVLANEQVQNGVCWRHEDTKVEIKHLKQWFFKITDYADELYEEIEGLVNWPEKTRAMQKNWIGKSHGLEIDFLINNQKWNVFTTRPDTIFGVTFLVVSAQHKRLDELVTREQGEAVNEFLKKIKTVSQKSMKEVDDLDKEGVFTGSYAINPVNGERIPVYAGNFVVADYGAGMVMAVPMHDKRDYEFANKYNIRMQKVIEGELQEKNKAYTGPGRLINSGEFNGINSSDAIEKISNYIQDKGIGRKTVNFKLRDWGISRQRYWGTPIPIIHCQSCGAVPVMERDLPVKLPQDVQFGKGNPLETNNEWLNVECPRCNGKARREADTMDTFVNSSWYFLRYADPKNKDIIFDKEKVKYWMPIDTYVGGAEHACMHLIYCRFYTKFLRDLGLIDFGEPIKRLFHQGMLQGEDGNKMSKSKGNVVLPETVSKEYGMDTARFFMCNLASPDKDILWSNAGIVGSLRFIKKIFSFAGSFTEKQDSKELSIKINKTIENITNYYDNFEYRKATIELRALFDEIEKNGCSKKTYESFLKLLSPICPHITEELWSKLKNTGLITTSSWPIAEKLNFDESQEESITTKTIQEIKKVVDKTPGAIDKIYVYAMPFELDKIDENTLASAFNSKIVLYSVSDKSKYDPNNKAKRALPGKPAVYAE